MVAELISGGELDMDEPLVQQPIARLGTADEMAAACLGLFAGVVDRASQRRADTRHRAEGGLNPSFRDVQLCGAIDHVIATHDS